jgi:hypothetical protein
MPSREILREEQLWDSLKDGASLARIMQKWIPVLRTEYAPVKAAF